MPRRRGGQRSGNASRKGLAITELAVCLPVIVAIVLAAIEACNMIYLRQTLLIAAYEGARVALIPDTTSGNVIGQCQQILNDRQVRDSSVSVNPANIQSAPFGTFIRVTVTAPMAPNSLFGGMFFGTRVLTGEVQMMKET